MPKINNNLLACAITGVLLIPVMIYVNPGEDPKHVVGTAVVILMGVFGFMQIVDMLTRR
jgi:hypothetical protein